MWTGLITARRWRAVLCTGLLTALLLPVTSAGAIAGFGDVSNDRYFTEAVQWSVDEGITQILDNCFSPDQPVTRGETALWFWRMQNKPKAPPHSFVDVTAPQQQEAVSWMSHTEITTGTSPTTYDPDRVLNRVEVAAFLWRLEGKPSAAEHPFVDVHKTWQQQPVSWMSSTGITTGTSPTTFSPDDTLTRAQLVTFLYRYNSSPAVVVNPTSPICDPNAPGDISIPPDDDDLEEIPPDPNFDDSEEHQFGES